MERSVLSSLIKRQSESPSASTAFETRASVVEDEPTKIEKPLQKTGRSLRNPLGAKRIKRGFKKVAGVLRWVCHQTNAFTLRPDVKNASKEEYAWPFKSNPSVSARSPCHTRGGNSKFHSSRPCTRVKPPTNSTHDGGVRETTSLREWVWTQDEAALHGHLENRHGRGVDYQTTTRDLLVLSEAAGKSLNQDFLLSNFPSNEEGWDIISEALDFNKYVLSILEGIFNQVGDKWDSDNPSISVDSNEVPYINDTEDNELYLSLCNSFDEMSTEASGFCLRGISLVAQCIIECQGITDFAPVSLFQAALEFVNTSGRINQVQQKMIIKRRGELAVIDWSLEQEQSRVEHFLELIEAVSGCVITSQNRVLLSVLVYPPGIGTHNEETSKLEYYLQQSWTWLNKLSKRVIALCLSGKQTLFVYLLERFVNVTGELAQYQKMLPDVHDAACKKRLANATSSCQKILFCSLMQLLKRADKAGLKVKKEGLVLAFDFCKTAEASQLYSITLTLLLSAIAEQRSTTSQSHHFTETLKKYGVELMCFAKPCVEAISVLAHESASRTSGTNGGARDVTDGHDNAHLELPASVDLGVRLILTEMLLKATNEGHNGQVIDPQNSTGAKRPPLAVHRRTVVKIAKHAKPTPFAKLENRPNIKTPEDASEGDAALTSKTIAALESFKSLSEGADESLDRRLLPMPIPGHCNTVNTRTMTKLKNLGGGSSGQVSLVLYNSSRGALKRLTCQNVAKVEQRLERECTVHEKINSCGNIVRFLGRAVETDQFGTDHLVGIITEWCNLGDLGKALEEAVYVQELDLDNQDISFMENRIGYRLYKDWVKKLEVIVSIAAGMVYMHDQNIVHRDLISANVFVSSIGNSEEFEVKIGDFERAYYLPDGEPIQRTRAPANSAPWMGPEVLNHEKYGLKADVYSMGTILWQLMYLENPWTHLSTKCFGADNIAVQCLLSLGRISLSISEDDAPDNVPEFPELVQLVKRAWARDPDNRPTMAEFHKEVMDICTRLKERVHTEGSIT